MNNLTIPEKFLLIAHHPTRGRFMLRSIYLKYGLTGSVLLEMSLKIPIQFDRGKLIPGEIPGEGHPVVLDFARKIREARHPHTIRYWIRSLARRSNHHVRIFLGELEKKRILRIEERKFLGLLPYHLSFLIQRKLQYDLVREIRYSLLHSGEIDNEQAALLGLIQACRMQRIITTDRSERKLVRSKLKTLLKESPVAEGVDQTIRQVQAAIIGAVAASSAAAAAAGSH
jgi:hypothetical protein